MIRLIHGSDTAASRKKLQDTVNNINGETVYFNGNNLTLSELLLANEAASFFSSAKTIVIENFFKGVKQKEKDLIFDYVRKESGQNLIVFWEDREVSSKDKLFKKEEIFKYDFPKLLFKFLDDLGKQPAGVMLNYFHSLRKEKEAELIFALIVRQFRLLIMMSDAKIVASGKLAPWQITKFRQQAKNFPADSLMQNYRALLNIDYRLKSGLTPFKMDQLIDIFLVNL